MGAVIFVFLVGVATGVGVTVLVMVIARRYGASRAVRPTEGLYRLEKVGMRGDTEVFEAVKVDEVKKN